MIIKQIILVSILGNIKSTELRIRCILMLGWKRFLAPIGSRRIMKATCWNTNSLMQLWLHKLEKCSTDFKVVNLARASSFLLVFVFNALMLTLFVKSLRASSSATATRLPIQSQILFALQVFVNKELNHHFKF